MDRRSLFTLGGFATLGACGGPGGTPQGTLRANQSKDMEESAAKGIPFVVKARAWRDEQPGDVPSLHVHVLLERKSSTTWTSVSLHSVELRAGNQQWLANSQAIEQRENGFEIRASGAPTLAAGLNARLVIVVDTDGSTHTITVEPVLIAVVH